MSALRWYLVEDRGARREFILTGDVTEKADFEQLLGYLAADNVFDLAGIASINSSGARDLMRFLRGIEDAGRRLTLRRCSPSLVSQINMIATFAGSAKIESVMAPYVCEECEAFDTVCVDLAGDPVAAVGQRYRCHECGGETYFDDIEEHYFGFLRRGSR